MPGERPNRTPAGTSSESAGAVEGLRKMNLSAASLRRWRTAPRRLGESGRSGHCLGGCKPHSRPFLAGRKPSCLISCNQAGPTVGARRAMASRFDKAGTQQHAVVIGPRRPGRESPCADSAGVTLGLSAVASHRSGRHDSEAGKAGMTVSSLRLRITTSAASS
jgi:hypothetical protein